MTLAQLRHRVGLTLASRLLPERVLRVLHRHMPIGRDPTDGFTFWLDASYVRYVRRDRRRRLYYRLERWAWRQTGWKWLPGITLRVMDRR